MPIIKRFITLKPVSNVTDEKRFITLGPGVKFMKLGLKDWVFALSRQKVLHSRVGSWPYRQTLYKVEEAYEGQTLQLIRLISKLWPLKDL
jgi:hypothetical protein